jgi:hypothetical protein
MDALASGLERLHGAALVQLLDVELPRHPRYGDPHRLVSHSFQTNSQSGEDGIIAEILRRIGVTNRFFVEVGVGDGTENNTAFLASLGWSGVWVDGSAAFLAVLARQCEAIRQAVHPVPTYVTRENIAGVLERARVPESFDVLSLDVDQNTYWVWDGLRRYSPRVVVVEYNAAVPPDIDWKVNYDPERMWDGTVNCGGSLKAFERLGAEMGYSLVGCDFLGANAFFVQAKLAACRTFAAAGYYDGQE